MLGPDGQTLDAAAFSNEPGSVLFTMPARCVRRIEFSFAARTRTLALPCSVAFCSCSASRHYVFASVFCAYLATAHSLAFRLLVPSRRRYSNVTPGLHLAIAIDARSTSRACSPRERRHAVALSDRERKRDATKFLDAQTLRLHVAALTPIEGFSKRKPVVVRTNAQPGANGSRAYRVPLRRETLTPRASIRTTRRRSTTVLGCRTSVRCTSRAPRVPASRTRGDLTFDDAAGRDLGKTKRDCAGRAVRAHVDRVRERVGRPTRS